MLTQQLLKDGISKISNDIKTNASEDWTFENSRKYIIDKEYIGNIEYDSLKETYKITLSQFQILILEFTACNRRLLMKQK